MNYAGCKVKMIAGARGIVEDQVNAFLEEMSVRDYTVYDIKYQYAEGKYTSTHTAMIIYSTQ